MYVPCQGVGGPGGGSVSSLLLHPSQDERKRRLLILNSDSEKRNTWEREDLAVLWGGCQDKEEGKTPFWVDSQEFQRTVDDFIQQ